MSALPKKDGGSVMKKIANKKAFQDLPADYYRIWTDGFAGQMYL